MAEELANVSYELARRAAEQADDLALAIARRDGSFQELTFRQVEQDVLGWMEKLRQAGLQPGHRVVLMVPPSPNFFALTFALLRLELVPIFVDPGMGLRNLGQCLRQAKPHAFLGVAKAVVARRLFGWAPAHGLVLKVQGAGSKLSVSGRRLAEEECSEPGVAAVLFTSGSTGTPKGALYTHEMFCAQVDALRDGFGIGPGERDLSTFPLFALFSPALGMASIVPWMDASRPGRTDPRRLVDAIRRYECTNLFASPALVEILGEHCAAGSIRLPSVRRVLSAGAPARLTSVERLRGVLEGTAQVHTPYGATESLPVSSIGSDELLGSCRQAIEAGGGVCVGRPLPGVEVRIVAISDEELPVASLENPLEPGEVGEIVVSSRQTSPAYYGLEQATLKAKLSDSAGRLWHRMGDVGRVDAEGRLWMCGRLGHRVSCECRDLFTIPTETIFNAHPEVRRTALVGVGDRPSQRPVLWVEPQRRLSPGRRRRLEKQLRELAASASEAIPIERYLFKRRFPVDVRHNAKIFREQLAGEAERRLSGGER